MSIKTMTRADGSKAYRVRYLDEDGKDRYKTFDRKRDADEYARERRDAKQGLRTWSDKMTVHDLYLKWTEMHVSVNLSPATRDVYRYLYEAHIKDSLGKKAVQQICEDPIILDEWRADMVRRGVGQASLLKTIIVLQTMFNRALKWRVVHYNPVLHIQKPSAKRTRAVRPPTPQQIWTLLEKFPNQDDRVLIGLMGFAGLRPSEALALEWRDVRDTTLLIDKAFGADGIVKPTKTGQIRAVDITDDLRQILDEFDGPRTGRIVNGLKPTQRKWWQRYVYTPVARKVLGADAARPYDLRHARASQMIHEGRTVVEVAAQMGHSSDMTLSTYAHLFAEARR